jgi:ferredoxin-NADP reductase
VTSDLDTRLATVLFLIYVRVTDVDKSIGLRDIEKFDRLIEAPESIHLPMLNNSLGYLRLAFASLWSSYRKGNLGQTNEEIAQALEELEFSAGGDSWFELRDVLIKYVNYFAIDSGLASKLLAKQDLRKNRMDQVGLITLLIMNWKPKATGEMLSQDLANLETNQLLLAVSNSVKNILLNFDRNGLGEGALAGGNQHLICVDVTYENDAVSTYKFTTKNQQLWAFQPGQFLTFDIPSEKGWLRRSYSISSSPSHPYFLDVTVKRLTQGYGSNWFHDHVHVGKEIIARGPHGNFSVFQATRDKFLFIAAGVGITPLISMVRWLIDSLVPKDVIVFNRVHSRDDVIFAEDLAALEKRSKGKVRVITMSTSTDGHWPDPMNVLDASRGGAMTPELISFLAADFRERDIFLCGPESFMADVKNCLNKLEFNFDQLYFESFIGLNNSPAQKNNDAALLLDQKGQPNSVTREAPSDIAPELQCEVQFKRSAMSVICRVDDNLLDVAEFYGVDVSSSCRMGSCGSCKCVKISGDVEMKSSNGLSEAEQATQHVLLCVSHARSNKIVLDL